MSATEPQRPEVIPPADVRPRPYLPAERPTVVDGEVVRVIEIQPYENALTPAGGCTAFAGRIVTDPDEIEAIRRRRRFRPWGR
jgi:hypothetical protein